MIISLRRIKKVLKLAFIVGFMILIGLDIYIQIDAHFISKPFWKPPLLTGFIIIITFHLIRHVINQLLILLTAHPQLLVQALISLISLLITVARNLWKRRKKPEYIVIKDFPVER